MDTHKNARLTLKGREAMVRAVVEGGLSRAAAARKYQQDAEDRRQMGRRFRADGLDGLRDRSSKPLSSPSQIGLATADAVDQRAKRRLAARGKRGHRPLRGPPAWDGRRGRRGACRAGGVEPPTRWRSLSSVHMRAADFQRNWIFHKGIAMKLVAIDFETADQSADSACAIGIVSIENGNITGKGIPVDLPTTTTFYLFVYPRHYMGRRTGPAILHRGLGSFNTILERCRLFFGTQCSVRSKGPDGLLFGSGRRPPTVPFICTVQVARSHWNFRPANLPTVCTQLGISLKHHDAASDALACALIALRAMKEGFPIHSAAVGPRSDSSAAASPRR